MATFQQNGALSQSEDGTVFDVLGNRRRRLVTYVLARADEPLDIGTLAERVAALEADASIEEVTYAQRKSVYTGLHQTHLPKMERAGLIASDSRWAEIALNESGAQMIEYLNGSDGRRETARYGFGALTFVFGLLIGVFVPFSPVSGLVTAWYPAAVVLVVAGLSLALILSPGVWGGLDG